MTFNRNTEFMLSGSSAGFTAVDFWEWFGANCLDGSVRGSLAEYVIMQALGVRQDRRSWAPYDLDYRGYRIEVKSTSLFTAKHGTDKRQYVGNQRLVFSIEPKHCHVSGGEWTSRSRNSDAYIFALLSSPDAALLDAWSFYVALTSVLDETFPNRKTISLSSIEKSGFQKYDFPNLAFGVNDLFGGVDMNESSSATIRVGGECEKKELQELISCYQSAAPADRVAVWNSLRKYSNHGGATVEK